MRPAKKSTLLTIALFAALVGPDQQALAQVLPNDPGFANQYGLHNTGQTIGEPGSQITGIPDQDIDAPEGWRLRTDAGNIIVAIMDLGVDYNHPDLAANVWTNAGEIAGNGIDDDHNGYIDDVHGWDFTSNDNDPSGSDHGTVSAGVIGAVGNNGIGIAGVAWRVKLMVLRVDPNYSNWAAAIRYAVDNGAKVINHTEYGPIVTSSAVLDSALAYAGSHDVLYVTPATSNSTNNDILYPCNSPEPLVICVTAVNALGGGGTGYGPTSVDIAAPGNRIYSTVSGGYGWSSGTSHSGPYVSGAAALIFAQKPGVTAAQVKQILLSTVDPSQNYLVNGPTPILTGGRINLARALNSPIGAPQGFSIRVPGPNYSDAQGWASSPAYYETIKTADVSGEGRADVCARDSQGISCMLSNGSTFSGYVAGPPWSNASGWSAPDKYKTIQFADVNGDGKADICGRGKAGFECRISTGFGFSTSVSEPGFADAMGWSSSPSYYETIRMADISGDGKADVCARGGQGMLCLLSDGTDFSVYVSGPAWSNANGWAAPDKYRTIQFADVNGDGMADICGRAASGFECWLSNGLGFPTKVNGPNYSDAEGWSSPAAYETIKMADVNGDGMADVCARASYGTECSLSNGAGFPTYVAGPIWSNANGWSAADKYKTIRLADVNDDGKADICGRAATGIECWLANGVAFPTPVAGPAWSDATSWTLPQYYSTIHYVDVNADQKNDICGRTAQGYECWVAN